MKLFTVRSTTSHEIKKYDNINNKRNVSSKSLAGLADFLLQPQEDDTRLISVSIPERIGPVSFEMLSAAIC